VGQRGRAEDQKWYCAFKKSKWFLEHRISFVAYAMTANYRATLSEYQHVSKPFFGLVEW
jgi:hypothetical protein